MSGKSRLACPESIADLWGYPDAQGPMRPSTEALFLAISREARGCLGHAHWEESIWRMENILAVIKARMRSHWEEQLEAALERLVKKAKGGEKDG